VLRDGGGDVVDHDLGMTMALRHRNGGVDERFQWPSRSLVV
jgi:hypothetical protein